MRDIIAAFAEYERAIIRARTKAALATKKATGERYCCNAPFGHRWASDGRLAVHKAEKEGHLPAKKARFNMELGSRASTQPPR